MAKRRAAPRQARHVNVAEAKARFSALVRQALAGDEVVIARDNTPLLRLVRLNEPRGPRKPGTAKGQVRMAPDFDRTPPDFDDDV
jgi:antitoxin (DNA-binding transcriptional repressor) of toxin-antitoxin stability system